jgi:hypothetical protein
MRCDAAPVVTSNLISVSGKQFLSYNPDGHMRHSGALKPPLATRALEHLNKM